MAFAYTPIPILPVVESRLIRNVVLVFFTVLVVVLRCVARLVTGSKLGWDDYSILACLPQGISLLICQGLCECEKIESISLLPTLLTAIRSSVATAGVGHSLEVADINAAYISLVSPPHLNRALAFETGGYQHRTQVSIPIQVLYATCIVTAKISVLFFYLRVFTNNAMCRATKWVIILTAVWGTANLLQSLFVCRVHNGEVNFLDRSRCSDQTASFIASGAFNCISNLIINFLPLYTIWSLKVTVSTRLGLTTVFLLSLK